MTKRFASADHPSPSVWSQAYQQAEFYAFSKWGLRSISLILFLAVWETVAIDMFLIAAPSEVASALYDQILLEQTLLWAVVEALKIAVVGYTFAIAVGVPVGFAMGFFVPVKNALNPIIDALYSAPLVALIPFIIIIFGLTLFAKAFFVFLMTVFVIIVNTQAGVEETSDKFADAANVFGASGIDLYTKVYLRSAVPYVLTGLRLGSARAVRGMVVAELFIFSGALGEYLINSGARYEIDKLFAGVIFLSFVGVVVLSFARFIEQRLLRYRG